MKIKVIKSDEHPYYGGIEPLIGNTYEVIEELATGVFIYVPEWEGNCTIFDDEYEVIEG